MIDATHHPESECAARIPTARRNQTVLLPAPPLQVFELPGAGRQAFGSLVGYGPPQHPRSRILPNVDPEARTDAKVSYVASSARSKELDLHP